MEECLFCELKNDKKTLLYEDGTCYVILEKFPTTSGESLVIAKEHYEDILAAPDNLVQHMITVAKKVAESHKKKLNATGLKFVINQGIRGVHVHLLHFHIHVMPRYEKTKGAYINEGGGKELSEKERQDLTEKLKM